MTKKILIGMEPWKASGPGWSNNGVTLLWEDKVSREITKETVYSEDIPIPCFNVFLAAYHLMGGALGKRTAG